VRKLCVEFLLVAFGISLMGSDVIAIPSNLRSPPIGFVLSAENANAGAYVKTSGQTIYDGDRLETQANSTLQAQLGSGQIFLRQNTTVDVHAFPKGFSANLDLGTLIVSSANGQTFQVLADGTTIRPKEGEATSAQISVLSSKNLLLTGIRGTLEVSMGDELKTIEAGSSYRLEVQLEDSDPEQHNSTRAPGRNRFLLIAITAISATTGIVIWRALVSPSNPTN
jgi:hypothetical protein